MDILIKSLGILIVLIGIVYLLKPDMPKLLIEFFKKGKRIYIAGIIRLALAVLFLVAARQCRHFWVIFVFGIILLLSGLLIFVLGPKKLRTILEWYQRQSITFYRVIAVIAVVIGAVIIFAA
jgi:uncharacterized protein YjeT (DUF2065 family)